MTAWRTSTSTMGGYLDTTPGKKPRAHYGRILFRLPADMFRCMDLLATRQLSRADEATILKCYVPSLLSCEAAGCPIYGASTTRWLHSTIPIAKG